MSVCTGTPNQQGFANPGDMIRALGLPFQGTGVPGAQPTATAAPSAVKAAAATTATGKTGGNSVAGASPASAGAALLTPAFAPGSSGLKTLTGQ